MIRYFGLYGALLLLIQGVIACGPAPDQTNARQQPVAAAKSAEAQDYDTLVVAFGDSLYAGYQLEPGQGFAPQLQAALNAANIKARVHNAGVSGDTTAAGKARLRFVLDSLKRKPDLVVLGLGGNDMLRGIKPEQTEQNLRDMLTELKRRDIDVMLTGILASPNMGREYEAAFTALYPKVAKEFGAPLYPFFLDGVVTNRALMLSDGIHPNAAGITTIVSRVAPLVEKKLHGR